MAKSRGSLIVVMAILAGAFRAAADPPAPEAEAVRAARERYAGTWKAVAIEADGNRAPPAAAIVVTNLPDGSWVMVVDGREASRGTSRMDPLATPAEIDVEITEGDGKGGRLLGIYEVTETRRRLCFRGESGWRPRAFATTAGCGAVLVEFERQ